MHLRTSQIRGIPVIDDGVQQIAGFLHTPLIEPDTGRILGFFIFSLSMSMGDLFLQTPDIVSWGTRVHIRSADCLSPPEELIRLRSAFEDPRHVIGQQIRTKDTKRTLGICSDVQFNTRHFTTEWMFPRKFFISRQPLPMSDIIDVTADAIWVKDPLRPARLETLVEKEVMSSAPVLSDVVPTVQTSSKLG